ncbi:WXG100 family type VII secretion target [Bacillus pseudomycoides]|uniref:WXG100 family type VII secretion target n=1 Tax=Bacillus bingmayongensis TaxID=1150157 RepID=A0ABU5JRL2_9BACI|nr:WXG100 family type VII secretion target [Bacillus pseudomycoides]
MTQIHVRPEKLFQLSKQFTHYAEEVKHIEQKLDSNYQSIPWSVKAKSVVDQYWYEVRRQMNESVQTAHTLARSLEEIANKFLEADNQGTEKVTSEMKQNAKEKKEEGFWKGLQNKAEDFLDKATDKLKEIGDYIGDKVSDVKDILSKKEPIS